MGFDIHLYVHSAPDTRLDEVLRLLHTLVTQGVAIMASIDDIAKDVSDESTLIDGVSTLITGLQKQIADALAGTTLPPAVQAKVDAVFAGAESNKAKLTTALGANLPPSQTVAQAASTPPATP